MWNKHRFVSSAHPSADSAGTQPLSLFALTHSFTTTQSRALAQSRSFSRRGRDVRSHSHILHSCFARTHTHTHKHTHTRMHTNTHTHACKSKTADVPARCAGFLEPSTLDTHTPQAGHTHTHTQSHIHTHIQTHTHACMHKQDGRRTRSLRRISGAIHSGVPAQLRGVCETVTLATRLRPKSVCAVCDNMSVWLCVCACVCLCACVCVCLCVCGNSCVVFVRRQVEHATQTGIWVCRNCSLQSCRYMCV